MELSSVSIVNVKLFIVSVLVSLKATSPRDSLAVITPGVEEHLTVAVEGEIHPVENITLSISSVCRLSDLICPRLPWMKFLTALDSGSLKADVPLYSSLHVLLLLPENVL